MGWTSFRLGTPVKEWFVREWESNGKYKVLDCALVKRSVIYGAIKHIETGDVFCAVYLVRWSRAWYNFSYKDMTEHCGPGDCECPERIFRLLTPLTDENDSNGWAKEWRARVEEVYKKRKMVKAKTLFVTKDYVNFKSRWNSSSYNAFKKVGRGYVAGYLTSSGEFVEMTKVRGFNPANYELV